MLRIILNRLKPEAEKIIAETQAGFGAGRSTTEQIINLRILREKYLQQQQDLYHVFIDFKKAFFDRIWHAALWATMKKSNISTNLIQVIKHLYDKATCAVPFNDSIGDLFWHAALWATMKKYNISTNLIQVIKNLYNKATSAVLFNSNIGDLFQTTVGV